MAARAAERAVAAVQTKRPKYGNKKTEFNGIAFDSMAEAKRYYILTIRQSMGEISGLELQPRYPLVVGTTKVCTYVADFRYVDTKTGETVVEDVKGVKTPVYRLKAKLMLALHGIRVVEVTR